MICPSGLRGMRRVGLAVDIVNLSGEHWRSRATNQLQGARHAVLTTLCSRACRVVLEHPSFVLCGLFESASRKFMKFSRAGLLAEPGFELAIPSEQNS